MWLRATDKGIYLFTFECLFICSVVLVRERWSPNSFLQFSMFTHRSGQPGGKGHLKVALQPKECRHQNEHFTHLGEYRPMLGVRVGQGLVIER